MINNNILEISDLSMVYTTDGTDLPVLRDINLEIQKGQIVGLVGESGSGKSTLGKTIVGLLDKTDGEVFYRGKKLPQSFSSKDFRHYSKKIQMIGYSRGKKK